MKSGYLNYFKGKVWISQHAPEYHNSSVDQWSQWNEDLALLSVCVALSSGMLYRVSAKKIGERPISVWQYLKRECLEISYSDILFATPWSQGYAAGLYYCVLTDFCVKVCPAKHFDKITRRGKRYMKFSVPCDVVRDVLGFAPSEQFQIVEPCSVVSQLSLPITERTSAQGSRCGEATYITLKESHADTN